MESSQLYKQNTAINDLRIFNNMNNKRSTRTRDQIMA